MLLSRLDSIRGPHCLGPPTAQPLLHWTTPSPAVALRLISTSEQKTTESNRAALERPRETFKLTCLIVLMGKLRPTWGRELGLTHPPHWSPSHSGTERAIRTRKGQTLPKVYLSTRLPAYPAAHPPPHAPPWPVGIRARDTDLPSKAATSYAFFCSIVS